MRWGLPKGEWLQKFFINAYIALGRYKEKEVFGEKLDYKEFTRNVFQQIDNCNNYLVEHTALMSKLVPGEVRRRDIPEYGMFSVRELITNAVCHRDYEDQGGKIIKEHNEHPLNPGMPEIKSTKSSTLVTLFSTKEKFEEERYVLNKRQREIIDYIKKNGRITTSECAGLLNVSNDTSLRLLSKLRFLGLIDKEGVGRGTYYVIK